ncbi:unnamed protein product, partial [Rotaria magnacalcarata]
MGVHVRVVLGVDILIISKAAPTPKITQFKHLSQVAFNTHIVLQIFEITRIYIEWLTFLSSHSIQHYFWSKYSLQVSFNFQKLLSSKLFTLTIFQKYSSQSKCKSENAVFRSTCRTEEYF